jgi:flagellar M-ring protein FliF
MDQFAKLLSGLTLTQKISIVMIVLVLGGGIVSFVHWKHEGDFRPLYSSMAPEDAATVVQKLKETGVEYRLGDNGTSVLVTSEKLAESRLTLAAAGLPKTGRIGFELFDKANFGTTEFVEHINYQRALEGELERSVMSLAEVEQARVHLTLSKDSVFLDQQQPAKASVMLKLKPGAQISQANVAAVAHLVASAVEQLTPQAVSVLDMNGNLLSKPIRTSAGDGSEITSESLEVRQQIEHNLVAKVNATLEPLLGSNGFRTGVSVDCDLTSGEQQEETLDPSRSVMLSSQKTEDTTERTNAGGIPGTASNLPPSGAPNKLMAGVSRRTENITYQTSRIVKHTRIPQGVVRRMSLAVLVDQAVRWEGKQRVLVPPAPETLKTIKDLVAGVTGFNAERGDQLIVETLPFESSLNMEAPLGDVKTPAAKPAPKGPPWLEFVKKYGDLAIPVGVGIAVVLFAAFGLVNMMKKPKRPARRAELPEQLEPPSYIPPAISAMESSGRLDAPRSGGNPLTEEDRDQLADRVRQLAKRDPAVTANVLRMWLQDTEV